MRAWLLLASRLALLFSLLPVSFTRCDHRREVDRSQPDRCPNGERADEGRVRRVSALLSTTRRGRGMLERAPRPLRICFGRTLVPTAASDGTLTLDERESDTENAARLGHLLLHRLEGPTILDRLSAPCDVAVKRAVKAEARAHALELELRRQLGVTAPRRVFPFEKDFWKAPPERRVDLLDAYFWAHPDGEEGLPGFVSAYRQRCSEKKPASPPRSPAPRAPAP